MLNAEANAVVPLAQQIPFPFMNLIPISLSKSPVSFVAAKTCNVTIGKADKTISTARSSDIQRFDIFPFIFSSSFSRFYCFINFTQNISICKQLLGSCISFSEQPQQISRRKSNFVYTERGVQCVTPRIICYLTIFPSGPKL